MRDLLYLLGIVGFFLLMLAYAKACQRLAAGDGSEDSKP